MATIADRLNEARERADRSIRSVQRELHGANVSGSSYANVHAYFSGKTTPSVEFLQAAARALGVGLEWLITGEGEPTVELEAEDLAARLEEVLADNLIAGLEDGFGEGADRLLRGARRAAVLHTFRRFREAPHDVAAFDLGLSDLDLGRAIGAALRAPFDGFGLEPAFLPDPALTDYTLAATAALNHLTAAAHFGAARTEEDTDG